MNTSHAVSQPDESNAYQMEAMSEINIFSNLSVILSPCNIDVLFSSFNLCFLPVNEIEVERKSSSMRKTSVDRDDI